MGRARTRRVQRGLPRARALRRPRPEGSRAHDQGDGLGGVPGGQGRCEGMARRGFGAIFFTGASASVKGYAESAPFAMGKFALRGLAQSLAREFGPKNIHVAHFVIDGGIRRPNGDPRAGARGEDGMLDPDAIAESYMAVYRQHRSAWSFEVDLRPWVEKF